MWCTTRHEVRENLLDRTGVFRVDSSKRVSSALLLSCLIKSCLQTHAYCAPFPLVDLMQCVKRFQMQLLLALREGSLTFLQSGSIKHCGKEQTWVVSSAGFGIAHALPR
jgi:hypothetical protein